MVEVLTHRAEDSAKAVDAARLHRLTPSLAIPPAVPTPLPNPGELSLSSNPQPYVAPPPTPPEQAVESAPPTDAVTNGGAALSKPASSSNDDPAYGSQLNTVTAATTLRGDDSLSRRLAQHIRDYPHDVAGHLDYQLDRFLRDEPVPQLEAMDGLPREDREVLTALLDGLSNFRGGVRSDNNMLLSRKVRPLLDIADRVRGLAELTIPTVALCSKVQGFGVYDIMSNTFRAGQEAPVILYCEVANFSSHQNEKMLWETKLSQEIVLYTETGFPAWRDAKSEIPVDLSRNRRHDFYVFKKIVLPKTLSVGRYVLKVTIVDEYARRVAENSTQINLIAQ